MTVREAAGPLGRAIFADGRTIKPRQGYQLDQGANSLIVLRRTAFVDGQARIDKDAVNGLLRWAEEKGLGQEPQLVSAVAERRERAVAGSGLQSERLIVGPTWQLAAGLGERANAHEIGLLLHGTYGWPLIPGSTIKGVTRAYAVEVGVDAELVNLLLGPEPGAPKARRGRVAFLDALPAGGPLDVARDVLTPHVQPYYADTMTDSGPAQTTGGVPQPGAVRVPGRQRRRLRHRHSRWEVRRCSDRGRLVRRRDRRARRRREDTRRLRVSHRRYPNRCGRMIQPGRMLSRPPVPGAGRACWAVPCAWGVGHDRASDLGRPGGSS